jgi:hypothetical protein
VNGLVSGLALGAGRAEIEGMQSGVPITVRRLVVVITLAMSTLAFVPAASAQAPTSKSSLPTLECALCAPSATLLPSDEAVRATATPAQMAVRPAAISFARPTPPTPPRAYTRRHGIGRTWRFRHGRQVDADLTPSPERCAPQIAVRF